VTSLRLIGYWKGELAHGWPDVLDYVDADWDEDERHAVSQYLASGTMARAFMGRSVCRLCGTANGFAEYTDGTYIWPSGLGHYVDEHNVRLPDEFVQHAVERLSELETAEVHVGWWKSRASRP
jgi:hypothetical protein